MRIIVLKNKQKHVIMKIKTEQIKYAVLEKETKKVTLFRFKTKVSEFTGISVSTLDRNEVYENKKYLITNIIKSEI